MRSIKFSGLYSYEKETDLQLTKHTVVVGPNNSGKSNLFRIIRLFVESFGRDRYLQDNEISNNSSCFIEAKLTFSKDELRNIVDFFCFNPEGPNHGSQFRRLENYQFLLDILDEIRIKLSWESNMQGLGATPDFEIEFEKTGLKMFAHRPFSQALMSNKRLERSSGYPIIEKPSLHDFIEGLSNSNTKGYVDNVFNSAGGKAFSVEDIGTSISQDMSEEGKQVMKSLHSLMGLELGRSYNIGIVRLIGVILGRDFCFTTERRGFSNGLVDFINQLRTDDKEFSGKLHSLASAHNLRHEKILKGDGRNLSQYLFSLKESPKLKDRQRFSSIKEGFERVFSSENLSFDVHLEYENRANPNVFDERDDPQPTSQKIVVIDNNRKVQLPIDRVGSGLSEVLFLLTLSRGVENSVILLDEPSTNLHPTLMKSLLQIIESTEQNNQFIIITHSPELAHYELFDGKATIFYVKKTGHISKIHTMDDESKLWFEENKTRFRHQIDPRIFFGRCVILTEGESDRNLVGLAGYLASIEDKLDPVKNDIIVVGIGGKCNFAKYQKLLDAFSIPYVILADSDSNQLFQSFSTLSRDSIEGKGPVFLIKEGGLEELMRAIDNKAYSEAEKESGGSKPAVAFEFARRTTENNPDALNVLKAFLDIVIKKSREHI